MTGSAFRLEARGLKKRFAVQGRATTVLHGLSFQMRGGEILCVLGPSGSGKSSLLALLAGIDAPDEGAILVNEKPVHTMSATAAAAWRSHTVGYLFQDAGLIERMSARRNVELPLMYERLAPAARREKAVAALGSVGVGHLAETPIDLLSGGERRRVAFARILAAPRPLLLCDEPTAGLDPHNAREVVRMLLQQRDNGAAVVVATHDPVVAEAANAHITVPLAIAA